MLEPPHFVYSFFDVFRSDIGGIVQPSSTLDSNGSHDVQSTITKSIPQKGGQTGMLPLWGHGTLQEGVPKVGVSNRGETQGWSQI
jgi:hypothetical protein